MATLKSIQDLERLVVARKQSAMDLVQMFREELATSHRALRYSAHSAIEHAAIIEIADDILGEIDEVSKSATPNTALIMIGARLRDRVLSMAQSAATRSTNPVANMHEAATLAFVAFLASRTPEAPL